MGSPAVQRKLTPSKMHQLLRKKASEFVQEELEQLERVRMRWVKASRFAIACQLRVAIPE